MELMGYKVWESELPDDFFKYRIFNTLNAHSYEIAKRDIIFKEALLNSDILLPDGISIVWASKLINHKRIKKVAGADLHVFILEKLNAINGSCFYLGSETEVLSKIEKRMKNEFPGIRGAYFSPPFKEIFNEKDSASMIESVNNFKPDVLFVGMTAPKQEKWVLANEARINARVICSIGAVFDFYAGTVKRPSSFWIKVGLEFLVRFLKEPGRLWKRNIISTPLFLIDMIRYKFNIL